MLLEYSLTDIQNNILRLKDNLEKHSLGIPRDQMPQIASGDQAEFDAFLREKGIDVRLENVNISTLKIIQAHLNYDKVMALMSQPEALKKPVYVSSDSKVIDGNHRFAAAFLLNPEGIQPVKRIDMPVSRLLPLVSEFSKVYSKGLHESL